MTFHPRISVIVPTYNRVESLLKVIDAINSQTYAPAEILIADDGSSDETMAIVSRRGYPRLKTLLLDHSGLPAVARNAALNHASGDWIAFCDSDDFWAPNRLQEQVSRRLPHVRAICSNAWVKTPGVKDKYLLYKRMPRSLSTPHLLRQNWVVNSSVLIEKSLLDEIGRIPDSPSLKFIEDYAAWLRVSSISPIQVIDQPLLTYTDDLKNSIRGEQAFEHQLINAIGWIDFLAWMRSRGQPMTLSEAAISSGLPRVISTNIRLIKQIQR